MEKMPGHNSKCPSCCHATSIHDLEELSVLKVRYTICCCEALARQRYNVYGNPFVEPKDVSTASVRDLCLFIRGTGLLNVY